MRRIHFNLGLAKATPTISSAPAFRRTDAQLFIVAPVVDTSSTKMMRLPSSLSEQRTSNASLTFFCLSSAVSFVCVDV